MKKFFCSTFASALLIFSICAVIPSKVSAQDVWIADLNGASVYKPASSDLIASRVLNYCLNNLR